MNQMKLEMHFKGKNPIKLFSSFVLFWKATLDINFNGNTFFSYLESRKFSTQTDLALKKDHMLKKYTHKKIEQFMGSTSKD